MAKHGNQKHGHPEKHRHRQGTGTKGMSNKKRARPKTFAHPKSMGTKSMCAHSIAQKYDDGCTPLDTRSYGAMQT